MQAKRGHHRSDVGSLTPGEDRLQSTRDQQTEPEQLQKGGTALESGGICLSLSHVTFLISGRIFHLLSTIAPRKIGAAMAAVMTHDRAAALATVTQDSFNI